jgi:predicted RNase H-like HicB family nuclease
MRGVGWVRGAGKWYVVVGLEIKIHKDAVPAICENVAMKSYTVVVHEEPEGGFWAEVPALPGCYSLGEIVEDLLENIRDAIAGVLEVLREQGREPEPIQVLEVPV